MERIISSTECLVITAIIGSEAYATASAQPDLTFLHIIMPLIDGYETRRMLRNDPETRYVPVIVIATSDAQFDCLRAKNAGRQRPQRQTMQ